MFEAFSEPLRTDGINELAIMDPTGDTKVMWDPNNPTEVDAARTTFEKLTKEGFTAFRVVGVKGEQGEQIKEFDPKAGRIILTPALQGG